MTPNTGTVQVLLAKDVAAKWGQWVGKAGAATRTSGRGLGSEGPGLALGRPSTGSTGRRACRCPQQSTGDRQSERLHPPTPPWGHCGPALTQVPRPVWLWRRWHLGVPGCWCTAQGTWPNVSLAGILPAVLHPSPLYFPLRELGRAAARSDERQQGWLGGHWDR